MRSALARRTHRLLAVVWCVAVLAASVANFSVGRSAQGTGILAVGALALLLVVYRIADPAARRR